MQSLLTVEEDQIRKKDSEIAMLTAELQELKSSAEDTESRVRNKT